MPVLVDTMKCASCSQEIQKTFLDKPVGAYVKKDGKQYPVCDECQRGFNHEELLERV